MRDDGRDYWRRFACVVYIGVATIAAVAVTVVLVLAYGRAAQPPSFDVSDASLTHFTLSTSANGPTNISYNLTLTVTVRNPNWAMGATFRTLEVDYLFDGQRFGRVAVVKAPRSVVLRAGDTAVFPVVAGAGGERVTNLKNGDGSVVAYRNQSMAGAFDVLVGFCGQVTFKPHAMWCRLEVSCPLRLKLPAHDADGSTSAGAVWNATACEVLSPQGGC
jgi:hypothetical protein